MADYIQIALICLYWTSVGAAKRGKVIDLTYELDSETLTWPTNPKFQLNTLYKGSWGHLWLENNAIDMAEHTGTHMDAPGHLVRDQWHVHDIPIERLSGPGVIINVKDKAKNDSDYRVTAEDLKAWERRNGKIPVGAVVIMNSGWGKYYQDLNAVFQTTMLNDSTTFHFPGWHEDAIQWLLNNRIVNIVGVDTPSTDYAQTTTYPVHVLLGKENIAGLENVAFLDKLPESNFTIHAAVLKIKNGSGGPTRVFAVFDDDVDRNGHNHDHDHDHDGDDANAASHIFNKHTIILYSFFLICRYLM